MVVVVDRFHTFPMELGRRLFCVVFFRENPAGSSSLPSRTRCIFVFISFMVVVVMRRQEPPMSATTTQHCGSPMRSIRKRSIPLPFLSLGVLFRECVCTRWGSKDDEERRSLGRWPSMSVCVFLSKDMMMALQLKRMADVGSVCLCVVPQ